MSGSRRVAVRVAIDQGGVHGRKIRPVTDRQFFPPLY